MVQHLDRDRPARVVRGRLRASRNRHLDDDAHIQAAESEAWARSPHEAPEAPEPEADRRPTTPEPEAEHSNKESAGDPPPKEGGGDQPPTRGFLRRHPLLAVAGALALLVIAGGAYVYWDYTTHFQTTDDAFIAARQFAIAPQVSGNVTEVPVTDNQHVDAGAVIARIDDRDYRAAVAQAEAQVASAEANVRNTDAQLGVQQAQINENQAQAQQAQASLKFADEQASRYETLAKNGAGTVQNAQQ
jgi:membrane fusion protein (multidrug efflux system)